MLRIPYGQDLVLAPFPLITPATDDFRTTAPTIAAGDVKVQHDNLAAANPSAKSVAFTSGSVRPKRGDAIAGATSAATATVMEAVLVSGTWAGGDAAGVLFVKSDSGTFQAENLNNTTTSENNFATIAGALDAAGLFKFLDAAGFTLAIPGSQLEGKRGNITIKDQTATEEWKDVAFHFETVDHPDAEDPQGCIAAGVLASAGQTSTNIRLSAAPQNAPRQSFFILLTKLGAAPIGAFIKTYTAGATFDIVPYTALASALDDTWSYKIYVDARVPSHMVTAEGAITSLDALDTAQDAQHATTQADTATLLARLTAARGGYLDNLNVGGNVASSAEVTAIQNNTRVVRVVPQVIERPDSGTTTYRIELFLYDAVGNMEVPDSAPVIALVNQAGTDRSSRLDSVNMANVETGRYRAIYTASVGDTLEQLVWTFTVVEGGLTRKYGNVSVIVDTTAVDFTAADRAKLDTLHDTRLTAQRATNLDNLDAAVSTRSTPAQVNAEADQALADVGLTTTVTGRVDATISSRAAPGAAMTLTVAEREAAADAWLARHQKGGSNGAAGQRVADALAGGMLRFSIANGVITVLHADGTQAYQRTLTRQELESIVSAVP